MLKPYQSQLDAANKLIFVKRYDEAATVLDRLLASDDGRYELQVHLRRIELASMLKNLPKLRSTYLKDMQSGEHPEVYEVCLALADQQGELVPPAETITTFQEILRRHGPSAAAFFGIGLSMEQQGNFERAIYNYQQALSLDPGWTPACFGLSQVYYQLGDERRGDHFFYMFEQAAPYNVYGNFETHRRLCHEFLEAERFSEAEAAIQALSEWWIEHKGTCPSEIQIYELFASGRISEARGDQELAQVRRDRAHVLARLALEDPRTSEGVLYFIAKVLEEFESTATALPYYKRILSAPVLSSAMVQKIGSQFLALGEFQIAKELFDEAYAVHPEHPDVRFCLLVANLKLNQVNVEDYLIGRERLRQLADGNGDRVELLALLHSLMAKYSGDADVQGHVADVYLRLGNQDRAARHFEAMYAIDGRNRHTALKYAAFVMQYRDPDQAMSILSGMRDTNGLPADQQAEIYWLKSNYHARKGAYRESLALLRRVLAMDPWNVSYLVQEIINLTHLAIVDSDMRKIDPVLASLSGGDESKVDWQEFDRVTTSLEAQHAYELVYARRKLRFLYANGSEASLLDLVHAACRHDAARATYDLMKLLNTNFDSHNIYWALGTVFKEQWQLETAAVWFGQILLYPNLSPNVQAKAYLELADCLTWQGKNAAKAVEYAKLAMDLEAGRDTRSLCILAHACLKAGMVREAKAHLESVDVEADHEARYLAGLIHYRNGARQSANELWKPLLKVRSESLRFHNIKQEVLKFYFEGAPYLKAN